MTWLNQCLIKYAAEKHILPDTQVAAQPGVQTRDLMSYLAGVKCWASRHKTPVYAIKRDQMKGFDYLSPDGFYDAIRAYGLPMGHYYLCDILQTDDDALIISSSGRERKDPHTSDADLHILIAMVEATDDSYIFSKSIESLRNNTLIMERFQFAYGWMTNWAKSNAYILAPEQGKVYTDTLSFDSVSTGIGDDPMVHVIGRLPITIIRKVIAQNVVSKCRALLSLQPILPTDAEKLDRLIMRKVHETLGFPFQPSTDIANLPISLHGFGFPSISKINAYMKTVTAAATGTSSLVMRVPGRNVSILQGEQLGLIIALLVAEKSDERRTVNRILTDHLNSTNVSQVPRLRFMNGRRFDGNINITYTRGHSNVTSVESLMNSEADCLASNSQKCFMDLPEAPPPTFHMNDFTFYHQTDGWIESSISQYIGMRMDDMTKTKLQFANGQRMLTWAHDTNSPPEYPYTKAASAHSAAVQLYARSGQLATADILKKRGLADDDRCRLGCNATESARHVFLKCPHYELWRRDACDEVIGTLPQYDSQEGYSEIFRDGWLL
ncbi:hypothetical protein BJ912DRAFT_1035130 [Pholiota molesta]|nr:hypothetical protein BJ912DRAFT_1035130 [Pholiota molesta]